jgi:hypothetical protein
MAYLKRADYQEVKRHVRWSDRRNVSALNRYFADKIKRAELYLEGGAGKRYERIRLLAVYQEETQEIRELREKLRLTNGRTRREVEIGGKRFDSTRSLDAYNFGLGGIEKFSLTPIGEASIIFPWADIDLGFISLSEIAKRGVMEEDEIYLRP